MILQTHQGPQEPLQQWLSSPSGAYVALLVDEFAAPENRKDLGTQTSNRLDIKDSFNGGPQNHPTFAILYMETNGLGSPIIRNPHI